MRFLCHWLCSPDYKYLFNEYEPIAYHFELRWLTPEFIIWPFQITVTPSTKEALACLYIAMLKRK